MMTLTLRFMSLVFSVSLFSHLAKAETWKFLTFEAPPYSCEKCPGKGKMIADVTTQLEKAGIKAEFEFVPYVRAVKDATDAKYVGYMPEWPSDMPADDFIASKNLFDSKIVLVTLKTKPVSWSKPEELAGKKFGVLRGYGYGDDFEKLRKEKKVIAEETAVPEANFKKLLAGRIDAVLTYSDQALVTIQEIKEDPSKFIIQDKNLAVFPNIVAVNKKHPQATKNLEKINRTLQEIKF